jgi:hypothetical protein
LTLPKAGEVKFSAWVRSLVPVEHLQIVCNGVVARELRFGGAHQATHADFSGSLPLAHSGWCLLRGWNEKAQHPVLDAYPYATTSPVYVRVGDETVRSREDAAYFVAWIDRLIAAAEAHPDWNTAAEKQGVLDLLRRGRAVYAGQ